MKNEKETRFGANSACRTAKTGDLKVKDSEEVSAAAKATGGVKAHEIFLFFVVMGSRGALWYQHSYTC